MFGSVDEFSVLEQFGDLVVDLVSVLDVITDYIKCVDEVGFEVREVLLEGVVDNICALCLLL